jgi:hypothetical protein
MEIFGHRADRLGPMLRFRTRAAKKYLKEHTELEEPLERMLNKIQEELPSAFFWIHASREITARLLFIIEVDTDLTDSYTREMEIVNEAVESAIMSSYPDYGFMANWVIIAYDVGGWEAERAAYLRAKEKALKQRSRDTA